MQCRQMDLAGCQSITDASLAALSRFPAGLRCPTEDGIADEVVDSSALVQPKSEVSSGFWSYPESKQCVVLANRCLQAAV